MPLHRVRSGPYAHSPGLYSRCATVYKPEYVCHQQRAAPRAYGEPLLLACIQRLLGCFQLLSEEHHTYMMEGGPTV